MVLAQVAYCRAGVAWEEAKAWRYTAVDRSSRASTNAGRLLRSMPQGEALLVALLGDTEDGG
jgi:hypothetical protein